MIVFIMCSRSSQHTRHLLEYISKFPCVNPPISRDTNSSLDISKLLSQIRSRYKALCSTLGVHPRLWSSSEAAEEKAVGNSNIHGDKPSKVTAAAAVVDPAHIPVWKLDKTGIKKTATSQDLSF